MDADATWAGIERDLREPGFPEPALRRALDRWELIGPYAVGLIERFVRDPEAAGDEEDVLLLAVALCGQRGDRSAFGPLARLMRIDGQVLDDAMGDGVHEVLPGALCRTYDGQPEPLEALALDQSCDEILRGTALEVLAVLAASGALPRERLDRIVDIIGARLADEDDWLADTWATVVAGLAIERWVDAARAFVAEAAELLRFQDVEDFEGDLEAARAGRGLPRHLRDLADADLIEKISEFSWVADEAEDDDDEYEDGFLPVLAEPALNPFRDVGRNDPCPCGSGLKFKRCCMPA